MKILREPFLHFCLLGCAVFLWFSVTGTTSPDPEEDFRIVIDDGDRLRIEEQFTAVWQRPPSPAELQTLLDALLREEILVREARLLGLDQGDSVIRNRLVQKMGFLTTSVAQSIVPEDDVLETHLRENPDRFMRPLRIAGQQVFLGEAPAEEEIAAARSALFSGTDPATVGQSSLLPVEIRLSDRAMVDRSYGTGFFDGLDALPLGEWGGPVRSGYGYHLVRISEKESARLPPLDEIREAVLFDWRRKMTEELSGSQYQALRERYEVTMPEIAAGTDIEDAGQ